VAFPFLKITFDIFCQDSNSSSSIWDAFALLAINVIICCCSIA